VAPRFPPEPFIASYTTFSFANSRAAGFHSERGVDPMLLEVVKAVARAGCVINSLSMSISSACGIASPVYVPISTDWIPPREAGNHVHAPPLWFESDDVEEVAGLGEEANPIDSIVSQVLSLRLVDQNMEEAAHLRHTEEAAQVQAPGPAEPYGGNSGDRRSPRFKPSSRSGLLPFS
jgi:hypothetical protein